MNMASLVDGFSSDVRLREFKSTRKRETWRWGSMIEKQKAKGKSTSNGKRCSELRMILTFSHCFMRCFAVLQTFSSQFAKELFIQPTRDFAKFSTHRNQSYQQRKSCLIVDKIVSFRVK
jgi:hypothetical protein